MHMALVGTGILSWDPQSSVLLVLKHLRSS